MLSRKPDFMVTYLILYGNTLFLGSQKFTLWSFICDLYTRILYSPVECLPNIGTQGSGSGIDRSCWRLASKSLDESQSKSRDLFIFVKRDMWDFGFVFSGGNIDPGV